MNKDTFYYLYKENVLNQLIWLKVCYIIIYTQGIMSVMGRCIAHRKYVHCYCYIHQCYACCSDLYIGSVIHVVVTCTSVVLYMLW